MKNILDLIILKAVEDEPKCGYDIIGHVHGVFQVLLSPGTVYPLLDAMERQGILKSDIKGKKKFYNLTEEGGEVVKAIASEYMRLHRSLNIDTT